MMEAANQASVKPLTGDEKMAGRGIGKRRFLFLMWDGAGGTTVEARIVRLLLRRGHEVTVLGPATIESELRSLGCDYVLDHAMAPYSALRDAPPDELAWLRDHLWLGPACAYAHEVVATVAQVRADAVVTSGYLYGGMVGAQAAGLPAAALCTSLYGMPYRARELQADDPRRAFWEVGLKALNDARTSLGLPELASVFEQRDALERLLLLTIAALDDTDIQLPANARYVGPPLEEAAAESALIKPGTRPIVLVSFSTSNQGQGEVIQTVLDALADLPLHGIVTLGPALDGARLRVPEDVTVFDHLPHSAVLPVAAAVVTHAGHGTVMTALAHGVPMVCIPMGRDQYHVAERVASVGAGLVVDHDSAAGVIGRAIMEVLDHPGFRQHAAVMRRAIDDTLRDHGAVHELEALGSTAAPSSSGA
jgi:MGT family glycosyltransferase